MNVFKWLSSKHIDDFAKSLVLDISKKYPPSMDMDDKNKLSEKKITEILESVFTRAITFTNENKLGMYKKARLGNTFKWELRDIGYSDKFIELATEGLIVYIMRDNNANNDNPA